MSKGAIDQIPGRCKSELMLRRQLDRTTTLLLPYNQTNHCLSPSNTACRTLKEVDHAGRKTTGRADSVLLCAVYVALWVDCCFGTGAICGAGAGPLTPDGQSVVR